MVIAVVFFAAGFWESLDAAETPAPSPACSAQGVTAQQVREGWPKLVGGTPLEKWEVLDTQLGPCLPDGSVEGQLVLAPPVSWSPLQLNYRVRVVIALDAATGRVKKGVEAGMRKWIEAVRDHLQRAEQREELVRFLERYAPVFGELTVASGVLDPTLSFSGSREDKSDKKIPQLSLAFSSELRLEVVSYQLPRIDGLPVRRELLRFGELLSKTHPRCLATWVIAGWGGGRWDIQAELRGKSCPPVYKASMDAERRLLPSGTAEVQKAP